MQIENGNTLEAHIDSVWNMIAAKWNDPLYLPKTVAKPDLHSVCECPIPVSYDLISHIQKETLKKVEEK